MKSNGKTNHSKQTSPMYTGGQKFGILKLILFSEKKKKNKEKDKSKKLMSSKVWSIRIQKHAKMTQHHVFIRSTDQFNQVGCMKKNDRNEINNVDDHRVWLCIRATFFSSTVSGWLSR